MAGKKGTRHATGTVSPERLHIVGELILKGFANSEIEHMLADRFSVDPRTIRRYMTTVRQTWRAEEGELDVVTERAVIRQKIRDTYQRARRDDNYLACNQLLRTELAMIPGGYAPREVSGPNGGPIPMVVGTIKLDEAVKAIEEVSSLYELARRRGLLAQLPAAPDPKPDAS